MRTTTKCERCQNMHGERTKCTDIMREDAAFDLPVERMPLPEFRNDHGPQCTCGDCVIRRLQRSGRVAKRARNRAA